MLPSTRMLCSSPLIDPQDAKTALVLGAFTLFFLPKAVWRIYRSIRLGDPGPVFVYCGGFLVFGAGFFMASTSPATAGSPFRFGLANALVLLGLIIAWLGYSRRPVDRLIDRCPHGPGVVSMWRLLNESCYHEAAALGDALLAVDPGNVRVKLHLSTALALTGKGMEARALRNFVGIEEMDAGERELWRRQQEFLNDGIVEVLLGIFVPFLAFSALLILRMTPVRGHFLDGPWTWTLCAVLGLFLLQSMAFWDRFGRSRRSETTGGRVVEETMGMLLANGLAESAIALGRARLGRRPTDDGVRLALAAALAATGARTYAREELERVREEGLGADQSRIHEDLRTRLATESPPKP